MKKMIMIKEGVGMTSVCISHRPRSAQITDGCSAEEIPYRKGTTVSVIKIVEWHPGWHLVHFRIEFRSDDHTKIIHTINQGRGRPCGFITEYVVLMYFVVRRKSLWALRNERMLLEQVRNI